MKRVKFYRSYSQESAKVLKLLIENNILFEEYAVASDTTEPAISDPDARHPYVGVREIEQWIKIIVGLGMYQKPPDRIIPAA